MFGSLKIGKIFGIDLYLHGTFWLLPLFVIFAGLGRPPAEIATDLLFLFTIFGCVALHEVGHALAAAYYGIRTRDITLYPIGGVAALERMPEKPLHEIVVALAGPAVNVVIAGGLFVGMVAGQMLPTMPDFESPDVLSDFVFRVFAANVILCLFNLLPAFPMDGGRVLRALLAVWMSRLRATEIAVAVSTFVALGFLMAGLYFGLIGLMIISLVVWLLGQAELGAMRLRHAHAEYERRVREMFHLPPEPPEEIDTLVGLPPDDPAVLAARRFTGLVWDEERRVWVQWVNGVPVRDIPT